MEALRKERKNNMLEIDIPKDEDEPINPDVYVSDVPVSTPEAVVEAPVNTTEAVLETPVSTPETVVESPVNTTEAVLETPVSTPETVVEDPVTTNGSGLTSFGFEPQRPFGAAEEVAKWYAELQLPKNVITPIDEKMWILQKSGEISKGISSGNTVKSPADLINRILAGTNDGIVPTDPVELKNYRNILGLHAADIFEMEDIRIFKSTEDALDDASLAQGKLYAVASIDPNKPPRVFERPPRDHIKAIEILQQSGNKVSKLLGEGGTIIRREVLGLAQGMGAAGGTLAKLIPDVAIAAGLTLQLDYPVSWYLYLFGSEDEKKQVSNQIDAETKSRLDTGLGPFSVGEIKTIGNAVQEWQTFTSKLEDAFKELSVFEGVDYEETILGRFGKVFAEEIVFNRAFAMRKFMKGRSIFKGKGATELNNAEGISETLNIKVSKAQKMLDAHKLGTSKELQALYLVHETQAALGFAAGWTAFENTDENGKLVDGGFSMLSLAGGVFGSFIRPGKLIGDKGSKVGFGVLGLYYKISDMLQGKGVMILPDDPTMFNRIQTKEFNRLQKRKRLYLRSRGLTNEQIDEHINNGTIDTITNQFLIEIETGDMKNFLKHINENLSDEVREEILSMSEASFDALSAITIHAKDNMGLDVNLYVDTIMGMARIQNIKRQMIDVKGSGLFKPIWTRVLNREILELSKNENNLQDALTSYIQTARKYINNTTNEETLSFLNWSTEVSERLISESGVSMARLLDQQAAQKSLLDDSTLLAKDQAIKSIYPYQVHKTIVERAKDTDRIIFGRDTTGIQIEGKKGLIEQSRDANKIAWDKVDLTHELNADTWFKTILDDQIENPQILQAILDIAGKGPSTSKMKRIINAVSDNNIGLLTKSDNDTLIDILGVTPAELVGKSSDEQFEMLQKRALNLSLRDKVNLIKNKTMTMDEVKRLSTWLGQNASKATTDRKAYKKVRDDLLEMLESSNLPKNSSASAIAKHAANKKAYEDARGLWRIRSKIWKEGPLYDLTRINKPKPVSNFFEQFLSKEKGIFEQSEIFREIKKGTPIGFDDSGNVIYKKLSAEESKFFDDGLLAAISDGMEYNSIDRESLLQIMESYSVPIIDSGGSITRTLSEPLIKKMEKYRSLVYGQLAQETKKSRQKLESIGRLLGRLEIDRKQSISQSFIKELSSITQRNTSAQIVQSLSFKSRLVKVSELSDTQLIIYRNLYKASHLAVSDVKGAIGNVRPIKPDKDAREMFVSPLEYIKIMTNDFAGEVGQRVKEDINDLLINRIIEQVMETTLHKSVSEGAEGTGKRLKLPSMINPQELDEILTNTTDIRNKILGYEANTILDTGGQASIALLNTRVFNAANPEGMPTKTSPGAALSRIYAWQRGVVGLRYLLGEATVKEFRQGQADTLRKILSDPDASGILITKMKENIPGFLQDKNLLFFSYHPASAYRAIAIATGVEVSKLETWFNDEEIEEFIKTAQVPDKVIKKIARMAEFRVETGIKQGTRTRGLFAGPKVKDYRGSGPFDPRGLSVRQRKQYDTLMKDKVKNEMDRLMSSTT